MNTPPNLDILKVVHNKVSLITYQDCINLDAGFPYSRGVSLDITSQIFDLIVDAAIDEMSAGDSEKAATKAYVVEAKSTFLLYIEMRLIKLILAKNDEDKFREIHLEHAHKVFSKTPSQLLAMWRKRLKKETRLFQI